MEAESQENNNSGPGPSDLPVLNISGKVEPKQSTTRTRDKNKVSPVDPVPKTVIPSPPQINPTTFPVISSRILLKTDFPPAAVPKMNPSDFEQYLCLMCIIKLDGKKRVYHMYLTNEKDLERDSARIRKMYENRKDLKIEDPMVLATLCARSLWHRVQNKLTDVVWNKQKSIFETDWTGNRDVWDLYQRIYKLHNDEMAKLFNYIKFLSVTNS